MFKDIVLAVTPSKLCETAAKKAFAFAKRFSSKLYLVHICGVEQGWGVMETLAASGETDKIKEVITERYKNELAELEQAQVIVAAGVPHSEILRIARKVNADLVVMGPHTKEFLEKRAKMWGMAGSCLERVSRKARCPVMIVTCEDQTDEQLFDNIVVATDFSDQAECAVAYGGQMARHYKAGLTVFHAVDPAEEKSSPADLGQIVAERKKSMPGLFEPRLRGLDKVTYECWEGDPAIEIIKLARMKNADMILMAHHSKELDPEKAFLGSTVVKVSLNSPCPTISINRFFDMRCGLMYEQTGDVVKV